jgi:phosphatidylserine/phosphatidylglycerophosphate/cardiolipin synthase-like enzyme
MFARLVRPLPAFQQVCVQALALFLALTASVALAAPSGIQVFFGPKAARDPQSLYFNLMRFLDSARKSIHGSIHEVDMISVAEKLAERSRQGIDVQLVVEEQWWNNPKNTAARLVLQKSKAKVILDTKKSGLMHNKFYIVDDRRVWTGSTNMTETCLLYNPNSNLWIDSPELAANYAVEFDRERQGYFGKRGAPKTTLPHAEVRVGSARIQSFFTPWMDPTPTIVERIEGAKKSVEVMCFVFSSQDIGEALIRAHQRGVKVRVLLDNLFSGPGSTARWRYVPFKELRKVGVAVKFDDEDSKFHHKVVIVDGKTVMVGSFNLSVSAVEDNNENLLIVDSPEVAHQYQQEFERWWKYYSGDPGMPPPRVKGEDDDG